MPGPADRTRPGSPRARARRGLRGQMAAYRQELECGSPYKDRREWLDWQIRKAEKLSSAAGWAYLCPGDLPSGQASVRGGDATGKCNPAPPERSARRPGRGSGHAAPDGVWRRQDPTRAMDGLYADLREFVHVHGTCGEMRATSCRASVGVHLGVFCSCGGRFDGWLSGMAATALHLYTAIPPDKKPEGAPSRGRLIPRGRWPGASCEKPSLALRLEQRRAW